MAYDNKGMHFWAFASVSAAFIALNGKSECFFSDRVGHLKAGKMER